MRRIVKGEEPAELARWKKEEVDLNLTYANIPKAVRTKIKSQMLMEQGYLCAYTMQQIPTQDDCQIEHVVPQSQNPYLQISYGNLLACAPSNRPGHRPMRGKCPFGAEEKGHAEINENNFVSPTQNNVEHRFRYSADGSVTHVDDDVAAENTVRILRLDHEELRDLRKAAIDERIFPSDTILTLAEAVELSHTIMMSDQAGRLPEFCLAISQAATWYANGIGDGS